MASIGRRTEGMNYTVYSKLENSHLQSPFLVPLNVTDDKLYDLVAWNKDVALPDDLINDIVKRMRDYIRFDHMRLKLQHGKQFIYNEDNMWQPDMIDATPEYFDNQKIRYYNMPRIIKWIPTKEKIYPGNSLDLSYRIRVQDKKDDVKETDLHIHIPSVMYDLDAYYNPTEDTIAWQNYIKIIVDHPTDYGHYWTEEIEFDVYTSSWNREVKRVKLELEHILGFNKMLKFEPTLVRDITSKVVGFLETFTFDGFWNN